MRPVILLTIPALVAVALLAPVAPAQNSTPRPDPIPPMQDMVFIPSGEFLMGSTLQEVYRIADVDEFPQRKLWVDDFYIDIHEVTNAQYKVYVDSMKVKAPPKRVNGK